MTQGLSFGGPGIETGQEDLQRRLPAGGMPLDFKMRSSPVRDANVARLIDKAKQAFAVRAPALGGWLGRTNAPRGIDIPPQVISQTGGVGRLQDALGRTADSGFRTMTASSGGSARRRLAIEPERTGALPVPMRQPVGGLVKAGPMATIYTDERQAPMAQRLAQGRGLPLRYNETRPGSAARADVLEEIWDRGGVPVIGKAGGARTAREDFGGVLRGVRGIDTRIRLGTPEAEAHAAALEAAGGAGGIYGSPTGAYRRLAPTRTRGGGSGGGLALFTGDRVKRPESKSERALRGQLALEVAKNAGQVEAARINAEGGAREAEIAAGAEKYKADRAAEAQAAEREAKRLNAGIRRTRNVDFVDNDGKPLPDEVQQHLYLIQGLTDTFPASFGKQVGQYLNNPNEKNPGKRLVPVYDGVTGTLKFISEKQFANGEMFGPKKNQVPRYATLDQFDPRLLYNYHLWLSNIGQAMD
mgnify:CR=1 FL=1